MFSGGCTLEAAEEICDADIDTLQSLIDKSLVREEDGPGGEPRYVMLETIREFALERLEARDDAKDLRRRHAEHCSFDSERLQQVEVVETEPGAHTMCWDADRSSLYVFCPASDGAVVYEERA